MKQNKNFIKIKKTLYVVLLFVCIILLAYSKKIPDIIEYLFWIIIILTILINNTIKEVISIIKKFNYIFNIVQLVLSVLGITLFIYSVVARDFEIIPLLIVALLKYSMWLHIPVVTY